MCDWCFFHRGSLGWVCSAVQAVQRVRVQLVQGSGCTEVAAISAGGQPRRPRQPAGQAKAASRAARAGRQAGKQQAGGQAHLRVPQPQAAILAAADDAVARGPSHAQRAAGVDQRVQQACGGAAEQSRAEQVRQEGMPR